MKSLSYQILYLLQGAWRQRYIILLPIIILPFIGAGISLTSAKQYRSHTSMLIQETAKMNPFLEDLAVSTMLKDRVAALNTLLHSRHILRLVAQERGIISDKTPEKDINFIVSQLSSQINMTMAGKDLIKIEFKSQSQDGMKETLESISRHFVDQVLAPERSSISDSAIFLKQNIEERRIQLDEAENALALFRNKHAFALPNMHAKNLTRLTQLKEDLAEREALLAGKTRNLGNINQQLSSTNPVIGRIEERIISIRGELAFLKTRYKDKHSKVIAAARKLRRLELERQTLLSENAETIEPQQLWDIASSAQVSNSTKKQPLLLSQLEMLQDTTTQVDSLTAEIKWLKEAIGKLEPQVAAFGQHEHELQKLVRDINVKRSLYEDLLERYELALVTGSLSKFEESKRVKVIDRPFRPTAPANLPLILFVIGGLLGGVFLGAGLALTFELTDTSIRRRDVLESLTQVPVLTRLPSPSFEH